MKKSCLFVLVILLYLACAAQSGPVAFIAIDKRVKTIQASNVQELARKLTSPYKTETEKTRAIFRWITENIAYDINGYHNSEIYAGLWQPSPFDSDSIIRKKYNDRIVNKVFSEKKAICDGYSRLFKSLCDEANIRCEIIVGLIRWQSDPIGVATKRGHAWNAVLINGAWKLIDATWASGYSNHEVTKFVKSYNDFFFFPKPIEFFNDHYPDDLKWSLLPHTPSLYQFYNYPFYYPSFFRSGINSLKPTSGNIEVTARNRTITIEIETAVRVTDMFIYENAPEESKENSNDTLSTNGYEEYKPAYKIVNGKIVYSYQIKSEKAERLNVVLNDKIIISYGIKFVR